MPEGEARRARLIHRRPPYGKTRPLRNATKAPDARAAAASPSASGSLLRQLSLYSCFVGVSQYWSPLLHKLNGSWPALLRIMSPGTVCAATCSLIRLAALMSHHGTMRQRSTNGKRSWRPLRSCCPRNTALSAAGSSFASQSTSWHCLPQY